jgi:phospholipid/cholesterol/gamma-HCH transport system substrate-binding protein
MKKSHIKLGIFFTIGMIILSVGLFLIGSKQNLFSENITISSTFEDVSGLQIGGSVRYIGITIGTVENITIENDTLVKVYMNLDKTDARFITKDAMAVISSDGLMGNQLVTIVPGNKVEATIKDGDELKSRKKIGIESVMSSVLDNSRNLEKVTSRLIEMTDKMSRGEGLAGKILYDTTTSERFTRMMVDAENIVANTKTTSNHLELLTQKMVNGEGALGKLVFDDSMAQQTTRLMDSIVYASHKISQASNELNTFAEKLNDGKGTIDMLVNDTTVEKDVEESIQNVKARSRELEETIDRVNNSWIINLFSSRDRNEEEN